MKKAICLILSAMLLLSLTACGGAKEFVWTREGYFTDEDDNLVYILKSDSESNPGWDVGVMIGEDSYGNTIRQEGKTLHGDLAPDYEEGTFIVTVSEEGKDGILLTLEGGGTYHLTYTEMSEEYFDVSVSTEGLGYFAYAGEDDDLPGDDEYTYTSVQLSLSSPEAYSFGAKAGEGWRFVKWIKDGRDYSADGRITVELTGDTKLVAVFELWETEWTRQGIFEDENGNILTVTKSDMAGHEGWYVGCSLEEDTYGGVIPEEGNTLHGDLAPADEEGSFVVTVSAEGGDGLLLEVEGGGAYHFTPSERQDAVIVVHVNVDGQGSIAYAEGQETPAFHPDYPYTSAQINLLEPAIYTFAAFESQEGWQFAKWIKDGRPYSADEQITLELAESTDLVAVFEMSRN